jgi:predicted nicotinamide N-methyase
MVAETAASSALVDIVCKRKHASLSIQQTVAKTGQRRISTHVGQNLRCWASNSVYQKAKE